MSSELVEQAVFTSARTTRGAGYQIVGKSPGVDPRQVQALSAWGPSHDSLLSRALDATSCNFFTLVGGAHCAARTVAAGEEYSERGGLRIYTQFLIVPPAVLQRFANNPFALLKAALADGTLTVESDVPVDLPAVTLAGRTKIVDRASIKKGVDSIGALQLAALIEAIVSNKHLAVTGCANPEIVLPAVIACIPPECRPEISFSTGLKFSRRRPCRVVVVGDDRAEHRQIERMGIYRLIDASTPPSSIESIRHGWSQFVHKAIVGERWSELVQEIERPRNDLNLSLLDALGRNLTNDDRLWGHRPVVAAETSGGGNAAASAAASVASSGDVKSNAAKSSTAKSVWRTTAAHGAHARHVKQGSAPSLRPTKPSGELTSDDLEALERLDDLAFEAISGDAAALEKLADAWPKAIQGLNPHAVDETREQYLRRALAVWQESAASDGRRNLESAAAILDILCLIIEAAPE